MNTETDPKKAVLKVLREFWPEAGGQSDYLRGQRIRDRCADAILKELSSE